MPPYESFHYTEPASSESVREIHEALGRDRRKIFVIGAGASKSAGIATFDDPTSKLRKLGGKAILSENVYRTVDGTVNYLDMIEDMMEQCAHAAPTPFHWMLDSLAKRGDDMRIYTQNIDGLELRCPRLTPRNVVAMHGQINSMACNVCGQTFHMDITLFSSTRGGLPACPICPTRIEEVSLGRTRTRLPRSASKRLGHLKPYIRLYDSMDDWPGLDFTSEMQQDIYMKPAHTVIVAGTGLRIGAVEGMVRQFSEAARKKHANALVLWVNPRDLTIKQAATSLYDYAIKSTCDEFAEFVISTATQDNGAKPKK